MNKELISILNNSMLNNMGNLLPRYIAIDEYLKSDSCSIEQQNRELCSQIVKIQLFVNYFYTLYVTSLSGAFKAKEHREQQAHLKYVNAYVIEGFKAFWGYKNHSQSLWGKFKKIYANTKDTDSFDNKIELITQRLNEYTNSDITDKDERDLTMHYQLDRGGSPKELLKLDNITIEKELKRYEQFGEILRILMSCVTDLLEHYLLKKYHEKLINMETVMYPMTINDLYVWNENPNDIENLIKDNINIQSNIFSMCKSHLTKLPNIITQISNTYNLDTNDFNDILSVSETMLALSYMSIDLSAVIKKYFHSQIPIERAIALSRMSIICNSVINRIYGYNSRKDSYWERYLIKPYVGCELPDSLIEVKNLMENCISNNLYSNNKRSVFAHLKEDNVVSAIKLLYSQNPFEEINNSIAIVKVICKTQNAIYESLEQIDKNNQVRNFDKYQWVDAYIAPYKDKKEITPIYNFLMELKKGNIEEALNIIKKNGLGK